MIYLILAIISAAANGVIFRLSQNVVKNRFSMLAGGYLACLLLALAHMYPAALVPEVPGLELTFAMGLVSGGIFLGGFIMMQYCVRTEGVVMSAVFSKLGLLVPTVMSVVLFGERPTLLQGLGFALAIAAILLMNLEKGSGGVSLALIVLLLLNGSCDSTAKIFEEVGNPALMDHFLVYSFFFALVLNVLLVLWKRERPGWKDLACGCALGIPNYFVARFLLKAVAEIPAVIVYPTYSVGSIILASAAGLVLFREKITRRQGAAMAVIMAALVLLNV